MKELLEMAIEQSSEGVCIIDPSGNIMFINRAFAEMHGYSPEEVQGKNIEMFHTAEQFADIKKKNEQLMDEGVVV